MRRGRLDNWTFRMLCPLLMCFVPSIMVSGTAHAQDGNIIALSKAERLVNTRYIPSATAALERRGDTELAALWHQAMAGQAFVQYELVNLEGRGHDIVARHILVPVEHGGKLLGLIGIDPYTGEFSWRMDRVSSAAELPAPPEQEQLSASGAQYSDSPKTLNSEDAKLVYIEGENYWYIPTKDGDDAEYVLLPLGEDRFSTLDQPGVLAGLDGFVIETDPLPSSPVEQLIILPEAGQDQAMGEPEPTMTAVTWMAEAVPYYRQDCKLWCWAASLSMQHQWWSPVRLGTSKAQQSEIVRYVKGRAVCAGGSADDIHRVVKEWHSLDDDYEDFLTTYKGPGKAFAPGSPTGHNNDPKTWLSYMQAPVIAFVDTSRNGKANHAILIVGYDDLDTGGVVYVHDPWYSNWWPGHRGEACYALAVSYRDFDKKWNTTYEGQFFGTMDGQVTSKRRGMVAGIPGDNHLAKVDNTSLQFSSTIRDDEMARVFDLTLGALHDDTAASVDSFGQQYASGILVELADSGQGNIVQPVDTGGFSSSIPALPSDHIYLQTHSIPENGNHAGASFHVDPKALGSIPLRTTWWVHDQDDRWHYDALISVLDDRGGEDTSFQMRQPTLTRDTTGPITSLVQVQDDDLSGPSVTDHTDSGDAQPGTYFFKIRLSDASGVLDDSEYPRIYFRWNNDEIDAAQHDGYLNADWDGSWFVATKTIGTDRLGQTLYWRTLAFDNDDDREEDRSAGWSSAYEGGVITQAAPPPPAANVQASDGAYTERVQVTWDSVSGANHYEVYQATSQDGAWMQLGSPSSTDYDDATAVVGTVYYYSVKACNEAGCSDFSEADSGYRQGTTPSPPANMQASDGAHTDRVQVTWDSVSGTDYYEVYQTTSVDGAWVQLGSPSNTRYDDTAAVVGTVYYYSVKACNEAGCSDLSEADSGYRQGTTPSPPANMQASDGAHTDRVQVTWDSVSGTDYYEVYQTTSVDGAWVQLASPSSTRHDDTAALVGTVYYYSVKACNEAGCGDLSEADSGYRQGTTPSPAANMQASDGAHTDRVQVTWDSVSGADYYEVYQATSQDGAWVQLGSPSSTRYDDTAAVIGTVYYYSVKACNEAGCGDYSAYDTGYRRGPLPPVMVNLAGMSLVWFAVLASISCWARKHKVPVVSAFRKRPNS